MGDDAKRLRGAIGRLRRRASAVRWVVFSGRAYLALAVLALVAVLAREYFHLTREVEILPFSMKGLLVVVAVAVLGFPLLLRLWLRLRRPTLPALARDVDARCGLFDLLPSGFAAAEAGGPLAPAVVRRAANSAAALRPEALYPARRSVARTVAKLVAFLAVVYFLGLPAGAGFLPVPGAGDGAGPPLERVVRPGLPPRADEEEPTGDAETEAPDAPDRILVRIVPAKSAYRPQEPVLVFVTGDPGEPMRGEHEVEVHVLVDQVVADLGETMRVRPGENGGAVLATDLRLDPDAGAALTPGKHVLRAVLREGDALHVSEPVEIEIEGPPSGGGGAGSDPEPPPAGAQQEDPAAGGGTPPPPEVEAQPRFVVPLFREGETVKKRGFALVPDPEAPPGTPPRRVGLAEAAREMARRPESAVPSERLAPEDRRTVSRYFDLLRGEK
jgi:hypothetical protein